MEYLRFVLMGCLVSLAGCGDSGPPLGTVEGTVTLEGKPVEGAFVLFAPLFEGGQECTSAQKTDTDGSFKMLYAVDRPGVLLGEHQVSISTSHSYLQQDGSIKRIPERIPEHYFGPDSILKFTVEAGANVANFELSKKKPK